MERKTAADFDPQVLILFDAYVHGALDRRGFLDKAAKYAVGGVTATMLLDDLNPKFAEAQQVAKDDARLKAEYVEFASPQGYGKMKGYLVRPAKASGKLPGVLVVHENRGLNPHIEDIARRIALDNFVAFAPDALTPLGGYPAAGEDEARNLFQKLEQPKTREDMVAAAGFLKGHAECTGRSASSASATAVASRTSWRRGCPTWRRRCRSTAVRRRSRTSPKIKARMLIHYAGTDERINAAWPAYEAALKAAGVRYEMHMYQGTQHGFNNDTTPRYDKAAAAEAWKRTMALFNSTLRT